MGKRERSRKERIDPDFVGSGGAALPMPALPGIANTEDTATHTHTHTHTQAKLILGGEEDNPSGFCLSYLSTPSGSREPLEPDEVDKNGASFRDRPVQGPARSGTGPFRGPFRDSMSIRFKRFRGAAVRLLRPIEHTGRRPPSLISQPLIRVAHHPSRPFGAANRRKLSTLHPPPPKKNPTNVRDRQLYRSS